MIVKTRQYPLIIKKLEALLRRLPPSHPKRLEIESDLAKRLKGYRGEMALDYHLTYLTQSDDQIFQDIRLNDGLHFFQMDFLILTPAFILILEVKNITGTLIFDRDFNQLIRISAENDKEEGFPDPIAQVEKHQRKLKSWLNRNKLPELPIHSLVVISYSSTIIKPAAKASTHDLKNKVVHASSLLSKIEILKKRFKETLSPKDLRKISRKLLHSNISHSPDVLEYYSIHQNELLTGAQCPSCFHIPMKRIYSAWKCTACDMVSKDAHLSALSDYQLLFKPAITNKEFCGFFGVDRSLSKRLLKKMNLPSTGKGKKTVYYLQYD